MQQRGQRSAKAKETGTARWRKVDLQHQGLAKYKALLSQGNTESSGTLRTGNGAQDKEAVV